MKPGKILMASMLAISTATMAFAADIELRITGSTAFRAATHAAISALIEPATREIGYVGTSGAAGATQAIYSGTMVGSSQTIVVQTSYSGSLGGIASVAAVPPVPLTTWPAESNLTGTPGEHQITSPAFISAVANVALADNSQTESGNIGAGFTTLTARRVGVVPFVWVKGKHADPAIRDALENVKNINTLQARVLLGGGVPLSFFTGSASDAEYLTLPLGRDKDSGTRLAALLEAGLTVNSPVDQYEAVVVDDQIVDVVPWAPEAGYTSGGTLASTLNLEVSADLPGVLLGYVGINDATRLGATLDTVNGTLTGDAVLTFNGEPFSYEAVRQGRYSFWNYEYLLHGALNSNQQNAVTQLGNLITNDYAQLSGIKIDASFRVERSGAGRDIFPN
ncbi:hypothetical protein OpiT1DRAFT_01328 [Opitutaceae bacterium TAV1]|nr:hypothetical protein OpiT1DRAFT_01328 [Opitutaceae bacterium TAV1]